MPHEIWQATAEDVGLGAEPFSELCRKVVLCITEDWFALSHFRPLIEVLREVARSVVVVTRSSGRLGEIEALGARVIDFDFRRASSHPLREAQSAWALARVLEAEDPDVVHLVANEAGGARRIGSQADRGGARGRPYDGIGIAGVRREPAAAALSGCRSAPHRLDAEEALLVSAGGEPRRSGTAPRRWRRPGRTLHHPGWRRRRCGGLPGPATAPQRGAGCRLCRPHDSSQRRGRARCGVRSAKATGRAHPSGALWRYGRGQSRGGPWCGAKRVVRATRCSLVRPC